MGVLHMIRFVLWRGWNLISVVVQGIDCDPCVLDMVTLIPFNRNRAFLPVNTSVTTCAKFYIS